MSGAEIAAEVAQGIAEAGAEVGNGSPLRGTIVRTGPADMTTTPPTRGGTQRFACTLVLTSYSARDRDGTNITQRDMKALMAPDAESDPRNGDKLEVAGSTYSIEDVTAVKPGGTVLMWECQVRSGST